MDKIDNFGEESTKTPSQSIYRSRISRKAYIVGAFLLLAGGILCVLGGLFASKLNREVGRPDTACPEAPLASQCEFSSEAKRAGLPEFLTKVHEAYYELHPEKHAWENLPDDVLEKNVQER